MTARQLRKKELEKKRGFLVLQDVENYEDACIILGIKPCRIKSLSPIIMNYIMMTTIIKALNYISNEEEEWNQDYPIDKDGKTTQWVEIYHVVRKDKQIDDGLFGLSRHNVDSHIWANTDHQFRFINVETANYFIKNFKARIFTYLYKNF